MRAISDFNGPRNDSYSKQKRKTLEETRQNGGNSLSSTSIENGDWLTPIRIGDVIRVSRRLYRNESEKGILFGTLNGKIGFFPIGIVKRISRAEVVGQSRDPPSTEAKE